MESHQLLRSIIKAFGCKRVASALRLSLSLIHKWTEPRTDGRSVELNPLDRVLTLMQVTGDARPLHWLCGKMGGYFVLNPAVKAWRVLTLARAAGAVLVSLVRFEARLLQAQQDGRTSPAAAAQLRQDWEELKSAAEGLVCACERGVFRCGALFYPLLTWFMTGDAPELVRSDAAGA